jgi:hypothetical protein
MFRMAKPRVNFKWLWAVSVCALYLSGLDFWIAVQYRSKGLHREARQLWIAFAAACQNGTQMVSVRRARAAC